MPSPQAPGDRPAAPNPALDDWGVRSDRYPLSQMPFVAAYLPDDDDLLDALEDFLLGYGYNTARAYLADLLDIYAWAVGRGFVFNELTEATLKPYLALLRRRQYSESTIRRRVTAWRQFRAHRGLTRRVDNPRRPM